MTKTNQDLLLDPRLARAEIEELPASRRVSLIEDGPAVVKPLLAGDVDERADAQIVFNNVSHLMAVALDHHDTGLFSKGIEALTEIWKTGSYEALYPVETPDFEASLWENLAINLYALGGLATASERWAEVRELTTQSPTGGSGEKSWLRQGQVASARSNDHYAEESILSLATRRLKTLDAAATEVEAIGHLARFDLLAGLIIGEKALRGFYPNAAEFSEELIEPFVIENLRASDSQLRQFVFADDTPGLVKALAEYDRVARLQAALARFRNVPWRWRGFSDARTLIFIAEEHML